MKITKIAIVTAALAAGTLPAANASAGTYVYDVTVTTSFGTQFNDCFTFKGARLFIAGLSNLPLITAAAPTKPHVYYTSVATLPLISQLGTNYAFSGVKTGDSQSGTLTAVGSSSNRDSYTVAGTAVSSCSTQARSRNNNWIHASH
jgi:hypothetical protein